MTSQWDESYTSLDNSNNTILVSRKSPERLRLVDAIIFDCDGVLVDVRKSYDTTIQETVAILLSRTVGEKILAEEVSRKAIYALRATGGFNNDWDTVYALLLTALGTLPSKSLEALANRSQEEVRNRPLPDCLEELDATASLIRANVQNPKESIRHLETNILSLTATIDSTGTSAVENVLGSRIGVDTIVALRQLFKYPEKDPGNSLIPTIFDEIYYGEKLLQEIVGRPARLHQTKGLIEQECLIPMPTTLSRLKSLIPSATFGLVTGRPAAAARFRLGPMMDFFDHKVSFFIPDEINAVAQNQKQDAIKRFSKPSAYPLLNVSKELLGARHILYVGDSMEDLLMCQRASLEDPRFLFAGVMSFDPELQRNMFIQQGADILIRSINDLPTVFEEVRRYN